MGWRQIFDLYIAGHGIKEIANVLNGEGLKTNKGKAWSKSGISYLLKNETYIGNVTWNSRNNRRVRDGQLEGDEELRFEGVHDPIVDQTIFEEAQKIINRRGTTKKRHPRAVSSRYLLSGLVRCSKCGATYQGAGAKSGRHHYYTCRNKVKKGSTVCSTRMIPVGLLEGAVITAIKEVVLVDRVLRELIALTNEELQRIDQGKTETVNTLRSQIKANQNKLDNLYCAVETGKIDLDDLSPRIRETRSTISGLEDQLRAAERLDKAKKTLELKDEQIREGVENLKNVLDTSPVAQRKRLIQSFIKEVTIEDEQAHIDYCFPINGLVSGEDKDLVLAMEQNGVDCWACILSATYRTSLFKASTWSSGFKVSLEDSISVPITRSNSR